MFLVVRKKRKQEREEDFGVLLNLRIRLQEILC